MPETNVNNILNLKQKGEVKYENGEISFYRKNLPITNIYNPHIKQNQDAIINYTDKIIEDSLSKIAEKSNRIKNNSIQ